MNAARRATVWLAVGIRRADAQPPGRPPAARAAWSPTSSVRRVLRIVGLGLLAGLAWGHPAPARGEGWALVIGVNAPTRFRRPEGGPIRPLKGAEQDARGMTALLAKQPGFHPDRIVQLTGLDATRSRVEREWRQLTRRSRPGDQLVLHFSGHGTQVADRRPFDETDDQLDEALCLADSDEQGQNLLLDDDLARWLDQLDNRDSLVILDCCHAGTGTKSDDEFQPRALVSLDATPLRVPGEVFWRELRGLGKGGTRRQALFACQSSQLAYERRFPHLRDPDRGGQFTQALLQAFGSEGADADRDGRITGDELRRFVNHRLDAEFNHLRDTPDARQQPVYELTDPQRPLFAPPSAR